MADRFTPPAGLAPTVPEDATPEQCIAMWVDLMNACEQFVLAGLRREIGPDGDLRRGLRRLTTGIIIIIIIIMIMIIIMSGSSSFIIIIIIMIIIIIISSSSSICIHIYIYICDCYYNHYC